MGMQACRGLLSIAAITLLVSGLAVRGQDCVTPYQSAARNSELTYFAQALEATGLVTAFNSSDLVATIFLPKNVAFENLLTSIGMTVDQAIANPGPFTPFLGQILEYHTIPNVALYAANFTDGEVVKTVIVDTFTVNTNPFTITPSGGGKATVTFTDFIACKAIEHVLDTVLLPQSVVAAYASSMNGGSTAAEAPLVMGTSGPDVLTQAIAAAPAVAVPVVVPVVPVAQVPTASLVNTVDATKTQVASEVASQIQALKAEPIVQPPMYMTPPPPAAVALPVVDPTAVALPTKEALAMGIKDKISSALLSTPPPPMPVSGAVSGVPQATSGTPVLVPEVPTLPAAGPVTALQLPTLDLPLPLPKKKKIPLPLEPLIPEYKFKLPDIKAEILSLGKDALSKLGVPVTLAPPPPAPLATSGAPVSGAVPATPVTPAVPAVLLPVKKDKKDIPILEDIKNQLLGATPPPPAAPAAISGAVSGTPVTPAAASPTPAALLPTIIPLKKGDTLLAALAASPDLAASKSDAAAAPLVIKVPEIASATNLPDIVSGNTYSPPTGYSAASASAEASASTGTVMAASGPEPQRVIAVGDSGAYNVSASCSTVPAVAQMVPSMADFFGGLQATGLDMTLNNATAMMTVFVPINAAFDAFAVQMNQTLNAIMAQKDVLQQLLEYHVVPGVTVMSANLTDGEVLQTALPGQTLKVQKTDAGVKVMGGNGVVANVIYPDVAACNAIIHVIDAVLGPAAAVPAVMPATPQMTAVVPVATAMPPQPMPVPTGHH